MVHNQTNNVKETNHADASALLIDMTNVWTFGDV